MIMAQNLYILNIFYPKNVTSGWSFLKPTYIPKGASNVNKYKLEG